MNEIEPKVWFSEKYVQILGGEKSHLYAFVKAFGDLRVFGTWAE